MLRDALKETSKIGLGQIVVRGQGSDRRAQALRKGLMIETLRYADEVQKPDAFFAEVPEAKPDKELLVARRGADRAEDQAVRSAGLQAIPTRRRSAN